MTHIAAAVLAIDPTAQVSVDAEDVNKITWHDGNPNRITAEQIIEKQAALAIQAEADAVAATIGSVGFKLLLAYIAPAAPPIEPPTIYIFCLFIEKLSIIHKIAFLT